MTAWALMFPLRTYGADADASAHIVDLSADQILNSWGTTAVRHELKTSAGVLLEVDAAEMCCGANTNVSGRCLVGIGFEPRNQLLQVRRRQSLSCNDPHGRT